jgi:hypothetical protein
MNNDDYCLCLFIQKISNGFYTISAYIDDLIIIGTKEQTEEASSSLQSESEVKGLHSASLFNTHSEV